MALGSRALLLFLVECEDGRGRVLESTLVPVAVEWMSGRKVQQGARDFIRLIEPAARTQVETAISEWRDEAVDATRRIVEVRIARERATRLLHEIVPRPLQQGLFDRRTVRQNEIGRAAAFDAAAECDRRIRALEQAATASIAGPRLVLALVPSFSDRR